MKIASWNVNSIKPRLAHLLRWLSEARPDVVLLQETKSLDEAFPRLEVEDAGYNVAVHGQKTYNGVAILSRFPLEEEQRGLPGNEADPQARYLEAVTNGVRVATIYAPNGNPVDSEKFDYKLEWMRHLAAHAKALLRFEEPVVLGGDYNVAPTDDDVYDPRLLRDDALCQPASRAGLRRLMHLGYTDAFRARTNEPGCFTWWDYRGGGWTKDHGMRIDHLLLSPQAADRLAGAEIDRTPRGWEKPSDHTPICCTLGG